MPQTRGNRPASVKLPAAGTHNTRHTETSARLDVIHEKTARTSGATCVKQSGSNRGPRVHESLVAGCLLGPCHAGDKLNCVLSLLNGFIFGAMTNGSGCPIRYGEKCSAGTCLNLALPHRMSGDSGGTAPP